MNIRNPKEMKDFAAERVKVTPTAGKIAMIYAATVIGLSLVSAVLNYVLGLRIDQTGGLSNMGTRSVLSTLQTMLPLVQTMVVMCVELGYMAAMLRIARGQYTSPNTLRLGFDRFWVLLRYTVFEGLIFFGLGFGCVYAGTMLYVMTPLAQPVIELLAPVMGQTSLLDPTVVLTDALYDQLIRTLIPAFVICGLLYAVVAIPVMYRLRMSSYVIIDKPGIGALTAMRESRKMMRGNCVALFKLDIRLWWFFLAQAVASVLCYGDQILPMLGIALPFSEEVGFFLFYGAYWVAEFLIFCFLRNRVEVAYALAYDAIRPQEKQDGGVVLGNIFQM